MSKEFLVEGQLTDMSGAFASQHTSDALPHAIVYDTEADITGRRYEAYIGVIFNYSPEGPKVSHVLLNPHFNGEGPYGHGTADIQLNGKSFRCLVIEGERDFDVIIKHAESLNASYDNLSMPVEMLDRMKQIQSDFQRLRQRPITDIQPLGRVNIAREGFRNI